VKRSLQWKQFPSLQHLAISDGNSRMTLTLEAGLPTAAKDVAGAGVKEHANS
jgi:hypothetical protein